MGFLLMLRGLGCRNLARLPVLSIPDTDNFASVSTSPLFIVPFHQLTFTKDDKTDPNVSSFRLTPDTSPLIPGPQYAR